MLYDYRDYRSESRHSEFAAALTEPAGRHDFSLLKEQEKAKQAADIGADRFHPADRITS